MNKWTLDAVATRFEEAANTAHRLPPVGVQGYSNLWLNPTFQMPQRYADEERPYRATPPSPEAIGRMQEVMRWVQCLEVEGRHLVWMRAERTGWRDVALRHSVAGNARCESSFSI